jgi:hypothetical protein
VLWHGGQEPEQYARQLASTFLEAGLDADVGTNFTIQSAEGLIVVKGSLLFELFADAFTAANVQFDSAEFDQAPSDKTMIIVGYKSNK